MSMSGCIFYMLSFATGFYSNVPSPRLVPAVLQQQHTHTLSLSLFLPLSPSLPFPFPFPSPSPLSRHTDASECKETTLMYIPHLVSSTGRGAAALKW